MRWDRMPVLRVVVVLLAVIVLCVPACAVTSVELLEVTGMLERVQTGEDGVERITLNVQGKEASGPLEPACSFFDEKGQLMERGEFLRRYMKRIVTLELEAESGVVVSCRVGS